MSMLKLSFGKSIKTQLIVLLFGLTAASIGVIGFLGIRAVIDSGHKAEAITTKSTEQRAQELLVQTAQATASKNSVVFQNVQRITFDTSEYVRGLFENPSYFPNSHWKYDANITRLPAGQYTNNDKELSSVFVSTTVPQTASMKKNMELTSYMDYYAPQRLKDEQNAVAVYYIDINGASRYYPNIGLAALSAPDYQAEKQEFFTVADPQNDPDKTAKWTTVYNDPAGNGLMITAAHPVYSNDNFMGTIGVDFTLVNIAKNIEDYSPLEGSYAFLIDNAGRAIALPAQGYRDILSRELKKGEFGPDLSKSQGAFSPVLKQMETGKSGFSTLNVKGSGLYVAYAPLAGTNFSLGVVARQGVLLRVVGDLQAQVRGSTHHVLYSQILPIAVLLLALVWVLGFLYIRFITGPITALTEKTNRIMQGSLTQEIDIKTSNNEVGKLAAAFNKMISELSASYKALERKVLEIGDAKAKDEAILQSIGDGMVVTDSAGQTLLTNKIATDLVGMSADQKIADRELYDQSGLLIPLKDRPMQQALATGKKVNRNVFIAAMGETKRALNITANPVVQQGRIIGTIQIIRDITKEKEVDRMKTEFISIASHQLRTPLSAIKWFAEMLLHGDAGKMPDEQVEFVKNISDSTDRMIEQVNALLNISRLESGRILVEPVPTDIKQLVTGIVGDLKERSEYAQQHLTVNVADDIPLIKLDPRLISQVYLNLLTNSIKYTPKGGSITVTINKKGNEVISQITDTGYGIPAGEQKKVFKKFFRGRNIIQVETDGTGLGMYLAKSIVDSSNGKIWFESSEAKGTTFWFSLPVDGMQPKEGEVTLD